MGETTFNPQKYRIQLKGKDYLETRYRIQWFRAEHPRGTITTEVINYDPVLIKATITDGDGAVLATGHAGAKDTPGAVWSGRAVEKAETAAIGRALGHAGYGTQFMDSDTDHPADSPVERRAPVQLAQPPAPAPARDNALTTNGERRVRDWDAIREAVKMHLAGDDVAVRAHFKNWIKQLGDAGKIGPHMTDQQVILVLIQDRAAQSKAGRGWYRDTDALAALNATLGERFGADAATLCKTLKVKLSDFPDAAGFLAHVEANVLDVTQSVAF